MSQLNVSTECPNCGAPLDFSEGANAVLCANCRSNLVVTGRKQVLSYYVPSKVTVNVAGALARRELPTARVQRAQLYFIPFYRLTGHDFQWQSPPRQRPADPADFSEHGDSPSLAAGFVTLIVDRLGRSAVGDSVKGEPGEARALEAAILGRGRSVTSAAAGEGPLQLVDRYVEKSFLAHDLPGFGVFALGVRSQVLRVGLVRPGTLTSLGTAVSVGIDFEAAMTKGLREAGVERAVYRQVLGRILSVIYFPFWVVELEQGGQGWLTIVDGVVESVVQSRAPLSLYTTLEAPPAGDQQTVGFRPLSCPNCGWDLPVNPDDVVFFCNSCEKAWQIHGTELTEVPHEIADVNDAGKNGAALFLPFWQLDAAFGSSPCRYCVPGFRYRRLKALADLTARLSAKPLGYERWTGTRPQVRGCFYDVADAALLAQFTAAGQRWTSGPVTELRNVEEWRVTGATLIWLPFKRESQALLDPFTGMALQEGLLASGTKVA